MIVKGEKLNALIPQHSFTQLFSQLLQRAAMDGGNFSSIILLTLHILLKVRNGLLGVFRFAPEAIIAAIVQRRILGGC